MLLLHESPVIDRNKHWAIRVAKLIYTAAQEETTVDLLAYVCGLMTLKRVQIAKLAQRIHLARGINEVRRASLSK